MRSNHKFNVAIIGRGMTAASAAWHLKERGIDRVCVIGPNRSPDNCLSAGASFLTSGLIDNVTRMSHQYGESTAKGLLDLGLQGFRRSEDLASHFKLPWTSSTLTRIATTEHEHTEMKKAVAILQKLGLKAHLQPARERHLGIEAVQIDGIPSASTNISALIEAMEWSSGAQIIEKTVSSVELNSSGATIRCGENTFSSEMIVVAAHLNSGTIIPNLGDALVRYADQVESFEANDQNQPIARGELRIAHHGHYVFWRDHRGLFHISGARFLRPMAGIDANKAEVLPAIKEHLLSKAKQWFELENIRPVSSRAMLECRPCDEIPIIGPMYGESGTYVATGYSGAGVSLAMAAGDVLAELIEKGTSDRLPSYLHPRRLRSMS